MWFKKIKFFAFFTIFSLLCLTAYTQEKATTAAATPDKKQELINKLLEVNQSIKMAETNMDLVLNQIQENYAQMVMSTMPESLKDKNPEAIQKDLIDSSARFTKRFKELYPQRINLKEIIPQIYNPIYNKHFTESELNDLIAFYQSPTGQKYLSLMPQVTQEAMQKSGELINPKIGQLVNDIMQEEKELLSKKAQPTPAATKAPAPAKKK